MQREIFRKIGPLITALSVTSTLMSATMMLFMAFSPAHAELGTINIKLTGTVVALGCTVDPGDIDKAVNLGEWSTKTLKASGDTTSPVSFNISLSGCTASGVTAAFIGTKDKTDSTLLALNSGDADDAQGVAVQIMDSAQQRIAMGDNAPRETVDSNGNVTLNFYANYVVTGNGSVTPGNANADTEFTLTYD
ncbi:fimbrial protein [Lonsdalea quercina]|uniref:fimbrial protein n=1 Tax=Lonsdalea quercina TaxID=71657 RepID=UPI0039755958